MSKREGEIHRAVYAMSDEQLEKICNTYLTYENEWACESAPDHLEEWYEWMDLDLTEDQRALFLGGYRNRDWFLESLRGHPIWIQTDKEIVTKQVLKAMNWVDLTVDDLSLAIMQRKMGV